MSTLKYRSAFTKGINIIKKANPQDPIIVWIDTMIKNGRFLDYYEAQDALGFRMGIEFRVEPIINEDTDQIIGWHAYLQFHKENVLNDNRRTVPMGEFKTEAKAHEYIAKQHFYKLCEIDNVVEKFGYL
uniref:hypothetical protein n=2 Tax=Roseivirga sp. TaxID=1964215 RepID=UPI0040488B96